MPAPLGLPPLAWVQCAMLALLAVGGVARNQETALAGAALAIVAMTMQWRGLIAMARVFFCLAVVIGLGTAIVLPASREALATSLIQGAGFGALMMVLGLLRQPVRRARMTRLAAETLLTAPPKCRFPGLLLGAHVMSLMFNIGIISMIGDLVRHDGAATGTRNAIVVAAMRGAALVSIWSPIGLGFAIVTAGLPGLDAVTLMATCAAFTGLTLLFSALFPLLPPEATDRGTADIAADRPVHAGRNAILAIFAISAILLLVVVVLHKISGVGFTLVSVIVLPMFALVWLMAETGERLEPFGARLRQAIAGLADMRSETAIFMSANVIGAALSVLAQHATFWSAADLGRVPGLPVLLGCLALIPLSAAFYLPNSIVVVMAAQILGQTPLGATHPLSLAVTLAVGWAMAVCVSPISAMCLITARYCDVSSRRVAHVWNLPFALCITAAAAVVITALYVAGH